MKPQLFDHQAMLSGRLLSIYTAAIKSDLIDGSRDFRVWINKQEATRSVSRPESGGPGSAAHTSAVLRKS